jgi:predicted transcriptional regulator
MASTLPPSVRVPEIDATLTKASLKLKGMEVDGLIETQDGDTYRITEKGNALAAQYREKV